jgi:protein O-mannosyl-transferase
MDNSDKFGYRVKEISLSEKAKIHAISFLPALLFILLSFLIYLPVLNRYYVADDFKVLYQVCLQHNFFPKGFFRPLSDLSIYMNYRIGGFNPLVFNSFNVLVHGINSYLVFLTCLFLGNTTGPAKNNRLAIFSSAIFLTYPFHNEAVVWILGRGASLACLFCLLALVCYHIVAAQRMKIILVCLFYFISMSAFESTILFPLIFGLLLKLERRKGSVLRNWLLVLMFTLILHLFFRYAFGGAILGNYGQDFFRSDIKMYLLNLAKTTGRLVLPPSSNAPLLVVLFILLLACSGWLLFKNLHKIRTIPQGREIRFLLAMLLIACVIPVLSGVSTQTSETDRALYFPSVFWCMTLGLLILTLVRHLRYQRILLFFILLYNLFFLEKNNRNWIHASRITETVINRIREISETEKSGGKVYLLNIPNEISGAYVFRQGFADALRIYRLDTARFMVVNYLPRQDLEKMKEKILPDTVKAIFQLQPDILLKTDSAGCRTVYDRGKWRFNSHPEDRIFFWNIDQLDEIQACPIRKPA